MSPPGKPETVAIHAGTRIENSRTVDLVAPLHLSAVGWFDSAEDLDASLDGKDFVYTRIRGQNAVLLEEAVAALEGAAAAAVFASGMAALRALWDAQGLSAGDRVVMPADGYGATRALYKVLAARAGVELHALLLAAEDAPERIRSLRPRLVLAESITNPLLSVPNLPKLSAAAHDVGAVFAVDGTFSSPALQRTLDQGADYALQSSTKWINGHSDATGGTVAASAERIEPLRASRVLEGAILGPFEAWLTLRGLRTLPVRMRVHSQNALAVARRLSEDRRVTRVLHPGLPSHPDHKVAASLLPSGSGGMLAFEIAGGGRDDVFRFLERVRVARPAPTLGDVATLVMHPATAAARRMTREERAAAGITENLVRVSVGLEDPGDIADDLLQAVEAARARR
ncbi:MAG TPA: PLP-dependent aspartate aminotransferase family protein [Myxococcaceae bacterium]|nr:PLP-dependent aspartate aminotransferase family protein [Myxococcaceae bacterium]